MVTIQLMVNREARSHIRSKCLSFYTLVFCRHHHFLFTHSLPLPRNKGSTWLVWSYVNTILLRPMTQIELPSSQAFIGLQGHVTSPGPSHLSHSTRQRPHSGLRSPQLPHLLLLCHVKQGLFQAQVSAVPSSWNSLHRSPEGSLSLGHQAFVQWGSSPPPYTAYTHGSILLLCWHTYLFASLFIVVLSVPEWTLHKGRSFVFVPWNILKT